MAEIFERVSFEPYNFRITRLSSRKSAQMHMCCGSICLKIIEFLGFQPVKREFSFFRFVYHIKDISISQKLHL